MTKLAWCALFRPKFPPSDRTYSFLGVWWCSPAGQVTACHSQPRPCRGPAFGAAAPSRQPSPAVSRVARPFKPVRREPLVLPVPSPTPAAPASTAGERRPDHPHAAPAPAPPRALLRQLPRPASPSRSLAVASSTSQRGQPSRRSRRRPSPPSPAAVLASSPPRAQLRRAPRPATSPLGAPRPRLTLHGVSPSGEPPPSPATGHQCRAPCFPCFGLNDRRAPFQFSWSVLS
jgi:hypothetical protein